MYAWKRMPKKSESVPMKKKTKKKVVIQQNNQPEDFNKLAQILDSQE